VVESLVQSNFIWLNTNKILILRPSHLTELFDLI